MSYAIPLICEGSPSTSSLRTKWVLKITRAGSIQTLWCGGGKKKRTDEHPSVFLVLRSSSDIWQKERAHLLDPVLCFSCTRWSFPLLQEKNSDAFSLVPILKDPKIPCWLPLPSTVEGNKPSDSETKMQSSMHFPTTPHNHKQVQIQVRSCRVRMVMHSLHLGLAKDNAVFLHCYFLAEESHPQAVLIWNSFIFLQHSAVTIVYVSSALLWKPVEKETITLSAEKARMKTPQSRSTFCRNKQKLRALCSCFQHCRRYC